MERIFGFSLLSFVLTSLLLLPFIDFLYKIKLQRQRQRTKDPFNNPTPLFDKMHGWKTGTPFGGGLLIIFVTTLVTLWAYGLLHIEVEFWELFILLFSFLGFGLLGFYDDLKKILNARSDPFFGLRLSHKFAIQWLLALILAFAIYFKLGYSFIYLHWFGQVPLGFLYIPFAAFVIVSFVNAFNISDGLDGLSSGLFIICLIALLIITASQLDSFLAIFIAILMGSVAAFLYFNIHPARIWLGDVGSLSLGAMLAVIGLLTGKIPALAFIGGVFVIEIASSLIQILSKKFLKRKMLPIAPLHFYFLKKGWEEPKIVMRAWLAGFIFALLGLYIAFSK